MYNEAMNTEEFHAFALTGFPYMTDGDDVASTIVTLARGASALKTSDIVVIASKIVSLSERRRVFLDEVSPSSEAERLASVTGKDPRIVEVILRESTATRLASEKGPIIAWHKLGLELTSAGVDRASDGSRESVLLLPEDPDKSARGIREQLARDLEIDVAVVIADSDGRPDRRGATVIAVGCAGVTPLRITEHGGKTQEETLVDLVAGAAGLLLGQRGRGAPVAVLRGVAFAASSAGVHSILHRR